MIKYYCPKCDRRFIEWGAQKLGFKCPSCISEDLLRVGATGDEKAGKKPSLKRRAKKAILPPVEEEVLVPELDEFATEDLSGAEAFLAGDEEVR